MDVLTCLQLVRQNMDEIPVCGIANQDRLVGCAHLLDDVIHTMEKIPEEIPPKGAEKKGEEDG